MVNTFKLLLFCIFKSEISHHYSTKSLSSDSRTLPMGQDVCFLPQTTNVTNDTTVQKLFYEDEANPLMTWSVKNWLNMWMMQTQGQQHLSQKWSKLKKKV